MNSKLAVTVLGSGAWGSTLAQLARARGCEVKVWSRRSSSAELERMLAETQMVVSAVSMAGVTEMVKQCRIRPDHILVSATKGLDPVTLHTPATLWHTAFPETAVVVLSGPNLSKEIQQGLPAATVVASHSARAASQVQQAFSSELFRVYTNTDPLGVELGGTLKNVIAIAVGVCDGLQLGSNAKAGLITRGLMEMIRVGTRLGARPETFSGLSGLGDLLATCNSFLSRNYRLGFGLGEGRPFLEVLGSITGTVEGVNTAQVLIRLAEQHQIQVPIGQQVVRILNHEVTPQSALEALMERQVKPEY